MESTENKDISNIVNGEEGKDSKKIDPSRLTLENLDDLTEEELFAFEKKWKNDWITPWRMYMLIPYNIFVGGCLYYYAKNFKHISKRFFKPKRYSIWEIIKYGTVQSVIFLSVYIPGNGVVTGLWHPIQYLRGVSKIKGKILDNQIKFDQDTQDTFLFEVMKYFGLSQKVLEKAKEDLNEQKEELEKKGYFMKKKSEDDDDEDDDDENEQKK